MPSLNFNRVIWELISWGGVKATHYISPKLIIRATRKTFDGRLPAKNQNMEMIVTAGRPNYQERKFIKMCIKAGEPFPVKKVQIKLLSKRKK